MTHDGGIDFWANAVPCMCMTMCLHTSKKNQKYSWSQLVVLCCKGAWNFNSKILSSHTFFVVVELAYFTIQDMLFIKQYVDGVILPEASRKAGISYPKSGVEWASFIRELFKEDVHRSLPHIVLSGKVEIHQSLFGRTTKYHCGQSQGAKMWISSIVEEGPIHLSCTVWKTEQKKPWFQLFRNTSLQDPTFSVMFGVRIPTWILWVFNILRWPTKARSKRHTEMLTPRIVRSPYKCSTEGTCVSFSGLNALAKCQDAMLSKHTNTQSNFSTFIHFIILYVLVQQTSL